RRWLNLSLRTRLMLLVFASVVPLLCMGAVREALDYLNDRDRTYDSLLTIANGTAVAIERDLQLRVTALETLAMSPALQEGDLDAFGKEAKAFLLRQSTGATLGVADHNLKVLRSYGVDGAPSVAPRQMMSRVRTSVFDMGRSMVMDLRRSTLSHKLDFTIDVPVFRDGAVVYDLFLRLGPTVLQDLVVEQRLKIGRASCRE